MRYAYKLTEHARQRMQQRRISPWHVLRALERSAQWRGDGIIHYYDPTSRVRVVVNSGTRSIITMYKTTTEEARR